MTYLRENNMSCFLVCTGVRYSFDKDIKYVCGTGKDNGLRISMGDTQLVRYAYCVLSGNFLVFFSVLLPYCVQASWGYSTMLLVALQT